MITGSAFRAARSFASLTAAVSLPIDGPLPPACEVEKNTGSKWSKSRSSRMRCTSTDPTMPRQPTMPTLNMRASLYGCRDRVAHFTGADLAGSGRVDVGGAQALTQDLFHRGLDALGCLFLPERVAQHHGRRKDGGKRIGHALAGDVGRRAVDRLRPPPGAVVRGGPGAAGPRPAGRRRARRGGGRGHGRP